jgi:hypothetical protein
MNSASSYKVSLGSIARTILYEDSQGVIRFSFDFDTSKGQNLLILERPANDPIGTIEQSRIDLAFERTKQHLLKQGHQVKIWPDEFETAR